MFNWTFSNRTQLFSYDDTQSINSNLTTTMNPLTTALPTVTNNLLSLAESITNIPKSLNATKSADISLPACFGFVILILATVGGNTLVLAALYLDKRLHSPSFYLIANMAIADLLLGLAVLPFSSVLELLNDRWVFGQGFCSAWLALDVLCCTASIMALMAVSIDRYIGVTRPLNYSIIMTTRRTIYLIIIVWAVSILTSVVPLFGLTDREKRPIDSLSDQDYFETCKVNKDKFYTIFSSMVSFYIPVVILLILYSRVYQEAKIQGKKLENEKRRLYELDYQIASEHIRRKQGNTVRRPSEQALDERRPMLSTGREKRSNSNATDNCKISASTSKNSNGKFSSDELTPDLTIHSNDGAQLRREYLGTRQRSHDDDTVQSGSSIAKQFVNVRRTLVERISSTFRQNTQTNTSTNSQTPSTNTAQMSHNDELLIIKRKLNNLKREKKAFRTLGLILGALLICWLPFFVTLPAMSMLRTYGMMNDENTENTWFKITFWLGYCNSALNPFVYAFSNRAIRRAFRRLLFRRYCCFNIKCWLCQTFCPEKNDPYGDDNNNQQFQRHQNYANTVQNTQVTPRRTSASFADTNRKLLNGTDSQNNKRRSSNDAGASSQIVSFVESVPDASSKDQTQSSPK